MSRVRSSLQQMNHHVLRPEVRGGQDKVDIERIDNVGPVAAAQLDRSATGRESDVDDVGGEGYSVECPAVMRAKAMKAENESIIHPSGIVSGSIYHVHPRLT